MLWMIGKGQYWSKMGVKFEANCYKIEEHVEDGTIKLTIKQ